MDQTKPNAYMPKVLLLVEIGNSFRHHDQTDWTLESDRHYLMGSIAVKPGCTMYMWLGPDFTGDRYKNFFIFN